ncbi:MAG TPA: SDR family oxidoreductase [Rhodospirillales bacterium]|nr:SDR family oxidoreductase [Rhodospirillales bacterium]
MPTVLITGSNRGLGLEFARQYSSEGWRVIATCRRPEQAPQLEALSCNVEVHPLDVTDFAQVESLAHALDHEKIDVLINNAGIYGPKSMSLGGMDYGAWEDVFKVNAMGPLKVCESFAGHVADSNLKTMATITSKMGSIDDNTSGGAYFYRASKAALNAMMKSLSHDLKPRGVTVAVLNPGWVRTGLGGENGRIGADESVAGLRKVIAGLKLPDSGKFLNFDGAEIPW